jgi:hypothetical protein
MTALLIRRRRPVGEPAIATATEWPFASTIRGTAGAGRLTLLLAELGIEIDDLRQVVLDPTVDADDLDGFDLRRRFETVALGSHLVNLPSDDARRAFLRAAVRHAAPGAQVLVEHHPIDWAETAEPTPSTPGSLVGIEDVRRHPPFVSAVSTYELGGHTQRQPFTARVMSDEELRTELETAGLVVLRRVSPTWLVATFR